MARREMNVPSYSNQMPVYRVQPNQIERTEYTPQQGYQNPRQLNPGRPQSPQIGGQRKPTQISIQRENMHPLPESINYSKPIQFNSVFRPGDNPEMDEEFDVYNLGIDLQTTDPLLPDVYYVGSDAPMIFHGQYPGPSYPRNPDPTDAIDRIRVFSDETLIFMFFLHARDKIQRAAFLELKKRQYSFDTEKNTWYDKFGHIFDIESFKFVQPDETRSVPILQ